MEPDVVAKADRETSRIRAAASVRALSTRCAEMSVMLLPLVDPRLKWRASEELHAAMRLCAQALEVLWELERAEPSADNAR